MRTTGPLLLTLLVLGMLCMTACFHTEVELVTAEDATRIDDFPDGIYTLFDPRDDFQDPDTFSKKQMDRNDFVYRVRWRPEAGEYVVTPLRKAVKDGPSAGRAMALAPGLFLVTLQTDQHDGYTACCFQSHGNGVLQMMPMEDYKELAEQWGVDVAPAGKVGLQVNGPRQAVQDFLRDLSAHLKGTRGDGYLVHESHFSDHNATHVRPSEAVSGLDGIWP